jgi:hypothetical protein
MKKWITLFVFLLFATALLTAGGCSKKEKPTKPTAKAVKPSEPEKKAEGAKPAEVKPATQSINPVTAKLTGERRRYVLHSSRSSMGRMAR